MSLFRDLSKAAIEADFGKNAFKVFNTLLHQTLGYGKEKDNLTDKRLAQLSCVRLDRVRPAIQCVINKGLFEREPSNEYDWHYRIGATHLAKHAKEQHEKNQEALHKNPNAIPKKPQFFTPALPKNGANFQKTDKISENQSHTALDLNNFLPYLQQLLQSFTPPAPTSLALETNATNAIATSVAEQLSTPISQLSETLSTSISTSLSGALQQALQPLQDQFTQHLDTVVHINQQLNHLSRYKPCGGDEKRFKSAEPERASSHNVPLNTNPHTDNQVEREPSAKQSENQNPTDLSTDKQKHYPEQQDANQYEYANADQHYTAYTTESHVEINQNSESSHMDQYNADYANHTRQPNNANHADHTQQPDAEINQNRASSQVDQYNADYANNNQQPVSQRPESNANNTQQPVSQHPERSVPSNAQTASEVANKEHHDIAIKLPDLIEQSAYSRCYKLLHQLTEEKQRDVLNVFNEMEINNKIRDNPTGLFIQLAKRAKKEALTVSKKDKRGGSMNPFANPHPDHPNIQYGYSQSPNGMRYY